MTQNTTFQQSAGIPEAQSSEGLNTSFLTTIILLVVGVLLIVLIFRKSSGKSKKRGSTFFFIGESGSGKTSLLYFLETNNQPKTVSSIKENEVKLTIKTAEGENLTVPCVDVPGHHHLRNILFDRMEEARAIILVIDSADKPSLAGVSDFLYKILIHPVFRDNDIKILLVLNKQDLATARKIPIVEEEIANEIEKIKISKRAIQEETEDEDFLKQDFSKFTFGQFPITFCEASVANGDVSQVVKFIRNCVE